MTEGKTPDGVLVVPSDISASEADAIRTEWARQWAAAGDTPDPAAIAIAMGLRYQRVVVMRIWRCERGHIRIVPDGMTPADGLCHVASGRGECRYPTELLEEWEVIPP